MHTAHHSAHIPNMPKSHCAHVHTCLCTTTCTYAVSADVFVHNQEDAKGAYLKPAFRERAKYAADPLFRVPGTGSNGSFFIKDAERAQKLEELKAVHDLIIHDNKIADYYEGLDQMDLAAWTKLVGDAMADSKRHGKTVKRGLPENKLSRKRSKTNGDDDHDDDDDDEVEDDEVEDLNMYLDPDRISANQVKTMACAPHCRRGHSPLCALHTPVLFHHRLCALHTPVLFTARAPHHRRAPHRHPAHAALRTAHCTRSPLPCALTRGALRTALHRRSPCRRSESSVQCSPHCTPH